MSIRFHKGVIRRTWVKSSKPGAVEFFTKYIHNSISINGGGFG
ncbi:hypothetical protein ACSZMW_19140 [Aeromonas allosaccharophila]